MKNIFDYVKILGYPVKDRVTGFEGTVTSVGFDLYGCVQCVVNPRVKEDGKEVEARWLDHKRLEVIGDAPVMEIPEFLVPPATGPLSVHKEDGPEKLPSMERNPLR